MNIKQDYLASKNLELLRSSYELEFSSNTWDGRCFVSRSDLSRIDPSIVLDMQRVIDTTVIESWQIGVDMAGFECRFLVYDDFNFWNGILHIKGDSFFCSICVDTTKMWMNRYEEEWRRANLDPPNLFAAAFDEKKSPIPWLARECLGRPSFKSFNDKADYADRRGRLAVNKPVHNVATR